jgi:CSLREA domain-containing protein
MRTKPLLLSFVVTGLLMSFIFMQMIHSSSGPVAGRLARAGPSKSTTTISVTTTLDEIEDNQSCSLREAIQSANTNSAVGGCAAGSGMVLIMLPGGWYTLTLSGANEDHNLTGDLDIRSHLVIRGSEHEATIIDGNSVDRVFHIHPGASVEMSNIHIINGRAPDGIVNMCSNPEDEPCPGADGGGILNEGVAVVAHSVVSYNSAGSGVDRWDWARTTAGGSGGGIFNAGSFTLTNSQILQNSAGWGGNASGPGLAFDDGGNGGGILNVGQMAIQTSTIQLNTAEALAGAGGGFYNGGTMTISHSVVAENQAADGWAGSKNCIHGGDGGGGENQGILTIVNSTISGNRAGDGSVSLLHDVCGKGNGGGLLNSGMLTLTNSTVAHNIAGRVYTSYSSPARVEGEGIVNYIGQVALHNSLLTENWGIHGGYDCRGQVTSYGYNLISETSQCVIYSDGTGDQIGRGGRLFPLADYGGPTWTHALQLVSPAIDAGSCIDIDGLPVGTDQRGEVRPKGAGCDIGAFERSLDPMPFRELFLPLIQIDVDAKAP